MRESEEAARLDIAADSLTHFISRRGEPTTRNEFFVTTSPKGSELHDQAMGARSWQKTFIQRLVDFHFLRQLKHDNVVKYEAYSDASITLISKLVFGGLSKEFFSKLCVDRYVEMKSNNFEDIEDEKRRRFMIEVFPDLSSALLPETMGEGDAASFVSNTLALDEQPLTVITGSAERGESEVENHVEDLKDPKEGTPYFWRGLAKSVFAQATILRQILNVVAENTGIDANTHQEIVALRSSIRDSNKEADELVKSLQGVLRQHGGLAQINVVGKLEELASNVQSTMEAVTSIAENTQAIGRAVESLAVSQKELLRQLHAAQDDKLGRAARDLEAGLALITEVVAERQA
jgi:hypothetical protein